LQNIAGPPLERADNWNHVATPTTTGIITNASGFVDSDGTAVSALFNFDLSGDGNTRTNGNDNEYNIIQRNYIEVGGATAAAGDKDFVLTNTASLFSNGDQTLFDLYVYVGRYAGFDSGESGTLTVTLDSDTAKTGTANFTGPSSSNTDFTAGDDYLVGSGLQASSGDVLFDVFGTSDDGDTGIGAFQIVESGVVPEPSSLLLCSIGALIFALGRRRRSVGESVPRAT